MEERDYKESKFLTRQKETALREAKKFLRKWERAFSKPLTKEQMIEEFKGFFPSEEEFELHLKRHAVPEEVKLKLEELLKKRFKYITFKEISLLLPQETKEWTYQYLKNTFRALCHPTFVFKQFPKQPSRGIRLPRTIIYSGYKKWFSVTLLGDKLISSHPLNRAKFPSLQAWIKNRRINSKRLIEVGIDEEIRKIANSLRRRFRELMGED